MIVLDHPLISDRVARLRDKHCGSQEFRRLLQNISALMVPQVTKDLETMPTAVETPLESTEGRLLSHPVILVPILRAGLGMAEGFLRVIPEAIVAHIGLRRNEETLEPEVYYPNPLVNFPDSHTIILDPMLATGGSAIETVRLLKEQGASRLAFACVIAAPEGADALQSAHPELPVFIAALDRGLNEQGYICPGLGDAGDRSFGTI
ncbi:MAG: uracil phosphoribosyltransferase [Verrucomicrobiota bacterium]|nr:uracil phosphoribosyltransferase [Verrucomicrobiota bacterium]